MIIDSNVHHMPDELFTDEDIFSRFMECVPRQYGEYAYWGKAPSGAREIVFEKPRGCQNLNYVEGTYALDAKLKDMAANGVDKALLKIPIWEEWMPLDLCKYVNNKLAEAVKYSNGKLAAVAILPPWGTKESIYELERCIGDLGMVGVQLACHYGEIYLDDEAFKPYFKVLNQKKIPALIHHTAMPVDYRSIATYNNQRRQMGRCIDQGTAVGRELFSGMFEEFPNLKFVHTLLGGAFFAYTSLMLPEKSPTNEPHERFDTDNEKYWGYLKNNLFFDMSCASSWGKKQLECAVEVLGEENVLFGSSYPVRKEWMINGIAAVKNLDISDKAKDLVLGGNAQRIFNL